MYESALLLHRSRAAVDRGATVPPWSEAHAVPQPAPASGFAGLPTGAVVLSLGSSLYCSATLQLIFSSPIQTKETGKCFMGHNNCSSCRWITDRQIGLSPIHQATKMQLFRAKRPACGFCGLVHVSLRKTHAGARASNNLSAVLVILEVITFSVSPPPVFWCNRWRVSISIGTCAATGSLR